MQPITYTCCTEDKWKNKQTTCHCLQSEYKNQQGVLFNFTLRWRISSKAFPRAIKDQIDEHIRPRFIGDIRDGLIKVHLRGLINEENIKGSKLLESAVDMEDQSSDLRPAIKQLTFNNINTKPAIEQDADADSHSDVSEKKQVNMVSAGERRFREEYPRVRQDRQHDEHGQNHDKYGRRDRRQYLLCMQAK